MNKKTYIIIFLLILIGVLIMVGINHDRVVGHGDKGIYSDWNADHKQKGHHDCEQFQHQNHVLENRTTYPAGPVPGQIIFRSDFPNAFVWTGTMWASLTPVATIVVAADGTGNYLTIQEGIDALPAGGGVVYIKEGTYVITSTITINSNFVSIIGSGTSTKIQTFSDITMMSIGDVEGTHLNKLYFYGDVTKPNNIGLYMNETDGMTMRDCRIQNCGSHGVSALGGTYNLFSGCLVHLNKGDGVHLEEAVLTAGAFTFSECQISSNDGSGIYADDVNQIDVADNEISFNKNYGAYLTNAEAVIIMGNVMIGNYWDGVRVHNYGRVSITNNNIGFCGYLNGGTGHGVFLELSYDSQISNNILFWNDGWDINIDDNCDYTIVIGNRCAADGLGGINDAGEYTEIGHNIEGL